MQEFKGGGQVLLETIATLILSVVLAVLTYAVYINFIQPFVR